MMTRTGKIIIGVCLLGAAIAGYALYVGMGGGK